ncbi:hypothetical protein NDU88_001477 [Pleurodeles waltl]|uniref:Uncharacterized protein n=1 Tax=Pleurodeles waltl TaxID=8319 RepID=A0AAV7KSX9_PLEWA|nr:hypothetical protein NDU88_001477 [Pleurodeles waltl]
MASTESGPTHQGPPKTFARLMAACLREPENHSRSVWAAAASKGAYSAPLWCQSSRRRFRPRSLSTAAPVLSHLSSPLGLTPHRRPLSDCAATTPSFRLSCGPEKPLDPGPGTRPKPAAASLRLSFTTPAARPSPGQAAPEVKPPGARPRPAARAPLLRPHPVPGPDPSPRTHSRERGGGEKKKASSRLVGDTQEQALSSAPLPQAAVFEEPPTPLGTTCLTHRRGRKAQQAYQRGPTTLS